MADIPSTPLTPAKRIFPYDDEYMIFDELTGRYVLTEKYITDVLAVDLDTRITERTTINPQGMKKQLLRLASNHVYNFIHEHNVDNRRQDCFIAKVPSLRKIIMQAMGEQFIYISVVGDLSRSTDSAKRAVWFDTQAANTLSQIVPELGMSILYTGRI